MQNVSLKSTFISHYYDGKNISKIHLLCDKIVSEVQMLSVHASEFLEKYPNVKDELFDALHEMINTPYFHHTRDARCSIVKTSDSEFTITLHGLTARQNRDGSMKGATKSMKTYIKIRCRNFDIDDIQIEHKKMHVTPSFKNSPIFKDPDHDFHLKSEDFRAEQKLSKSGEFVDRYEQDHKGLNMARFFRVYAPTPAESHELAKNFAVKLFTLLKTQVANPSTGVLHVPYDIKLANLSVEMPGTGEDMADYIYHIYDFDKPMFTPAKVPRICMMMLAMAGGDVQKFVDMPQIPIIQIVVALIEILANGKPIHEMTEDEKKQYIEQLNAEVISTLDPAIVPDDYAKICEMIVNGVFSTRL